MPERGRNLQITLTRDEAALLEFYLFQHRGLQNALEQFLTTHEYEYNEEHYQRLVNTYLDLYTKVQTTILNIVINRGVESLDFQNFWYDYKNKILRVQL
jgi:hypothetical protein